MDDFRLRKALIYILDQGFKYVAIKIKKLNEKD